MKNENKKKKLPAFRKEEDKKKDETKMKQINRSIRESILLLSQTKMNEVVIFLLEKVDELKKLVKNSLYFSKKNPNQELYLKKGKGKRVGGGLQRKVSVDIDCKLHKFGVGWNKTTVQNDTSRTKCTNDTTKRTAD